MTSTLEKIKADALEARKARNAIKANVLSTLVAEVCRNTKEPTEDEVIKGVQKFHKNLEKSLEIRRTPKLEEERQAIEAYCMKQAVSNDWMIAANEVLETNTDKVLTDKTIGWFVGQTMRATHGTANPAIVKSYFEDKIHKNNFLVVESSITRD